MSEEVLEFTGERFLPSCEREIWYEHYHRYTMVTPWVKGKIVVDAACGEGYGSHLMSMHASQVHGFDLSEKTIAHANKHYDRENLHFGQANVLNLPLADHSVDVVVSFETLEHLVEHEELMRSFKRVLKPGGVLIISTPDKEIYSDRTGFNNEFHVKELYRNEFTNLMAQHFQHHQMLGQKLMFASQIWDLDCELNTVQFDCVQADGTVTADLPFEPVYLIAVASDQELHQPNASDLYGFTEAAETVYGHYHAVIRAHIKAEKAQQELERNQARWLSHPIIGRMIRWFGKE